MATNARALSSKLRFSWVERLMTRTLESPAHLARTLFVDSREQECVEGHGTVVEEEEVRARVPVMTCMNALILAVVHPETVVDRGHLRHLRGASESVGLEVAGGVQGQTGERPFVRPTAGAIDAVPAMDVLGAFCGLGGKRPGLAAFGIIPAAWAQGVDLEPTGRALEHRGRPGQIKKCRRPFRVRTSGS